MAHSLRNRRFNLPSNSSINDDDNQGLIESESDEENNNNKNKPVPVHIPWKGIILAFILTLVGSFMLVVYICSTFELIEFKPTDSISYLILSFITIIPGMYHSVIAFKAFRGDDGYSFDDIVDLN